MNKVRRKDIIFIVISLTVLLTGVLSYLSPVNVLDDSYMFYRYAVNFLNTGGIHWNPGGEPAYGLTSVLYLVIVVPVTAALRDYPAVVMVISGFVPGILFVYFLFRLINEYTTLGKKYSLALILTAFTVSVRQFTPHFTSGMDTMFSVLFFTFCIILFLSYERKNSIVPEIMPHTRMPQIPYDSSRKSPGSGAPLISMLLVILTGALVFWVRPELLIFSFSIALFLFIEERDRIKKKKNLIILLALPLSLLIVLLISNEIMGSYLPLPFYAKVTGSYGKEFAGVYKYTSYIQIASFVLNNWLLFALASVGIIFRKLLSIKFSSVEKGLITGTIIYILFELFFVTQIMYYYQRFYYPVLPALFFIAAKSFGAIISNKEFYSLISKRPFLKLFKYISVFIIAGSFAFGFVSVSSKLYSDISEGRFAKFDNKSVAGIKHRHVSYGVDLLSVLPSDLSIAATEVGFCSAVNLNKKVIDLAGLNDKDIAMNGFKADVFFGKQRPDVLYLPYPHYRQMISDIINYPYFIENYDYFSAETLGTETGAAIYRKSKYYGELKKIFGDKVTTPLLDRRGTR